MAKTTEHFQVSADASAFRDGLDAARKAAEKTARAFARKFPPGTMPTVYVKPARQTRRKK